MAKKIVWFLVAAIIFVGIGTAVFFSLWDKDVEASLVASESEVPLDWPQQIIALSELPRELNVFRPDSSIEGNAAEFLLRADLATRFSEFDRVYRLLAAGRPITEADSAAFLAVVSDSVLDTVMAVSRMESFNSVPMIDSSSQGGDVLSVVTPDVTPPARIISAMLLRSWAHAARGVPDSAFVDVASALRLARLMYEQGTLLVETAVARDMIRKAAVQLAAIGVATSDSALLDRARSIERWAVNKPDYGRLLNGLSRDWDATIEIARNADVLPAWRSEAISQLVLMEFRPKNVPLGIPGAAKSQVVALKMMSDPRVAWFAGLAENTMDGFNGLGFLGRVNFLRGGI